MDINRKLASIQEVSEIRNIEGATNICAYRVAGWWVVDSIGKYEINSKVIYLEIDSWIPHTLAPFLTKSGQYPKVFNDVEGQRLKTIKLRGQVSQGLLLPLFSLPAGDYTEGQDLTEILGIQKYEKPDEFVRNSQAKGSFPSFIPKTDEPRIQNEGRNLDNYKAAGLLFEITEKLDGSSMTVYNFDDRFGVCSRNIDLKDDDESPSTFWVVAKRYNLQEKLQGRNIAVQGELVGPGIQQNKYQLKEHDFYVFNIFDIDRQEYMTSIDRHAICELLNLKTVPLLSHGTPLDNCTVDSLVNYAEGKSLLNLKVEREGIVYKCITDGSKSFKAISNKWLLAEKD